MTCEWTFEDNRVFNKEISAERVLYGDERRRQNH